MSVRVAGFEPAVSSSPDHEYMVPGAIPGFATPWQGRRGRIRTGAPTRQRRSSCSRDHGCAAVPRGFPGYPTHRIKSAQRELKGTAARQRRSGGRFRHGKATNYRAGSRCPATATSWAHRITGRIFKDQEHRTIATMLRMVPRRCPDSNPRRRRPLLRSGARGAESSPLDYQCRSFQWDQRGSNPHRPG